MQFFETQKKETKPTYCQIDLDHREQSLLFFITSLEGNIFNWMGIHFQNYVFFRLLSPQCRMLHKCFFFFFFQVKNGECKNDSSIQFSFIVLILCAEFFLSRCSLVHICHFVVLMHRIYFTHSLFILISRDLSLCSVVCFWIRHLLSFRRMANENA